MGEYEPEDSRNITGQAKTRDGRWTSQGMKPPPGVPQQDPDTAGEAAAPRARKDAGSNGS